MILRPDYSHEPPVPPPDVSSEEALAFVQEMQKECAGYTERAGGEELVRAYLKKWTPEERRKKALRIMADLVQGKAKAGEPPAPAEPPAQKR